MTVDDQPDAGERRDHGAGGAVVASLSEDPDAMAQRVVFNDSPLGICTRPWHCCPHIFRPRIGLYPKNVSRRVGFLALVPLLLSIGACGGSSHSTTAQSSSASTSAAASSSTTSAGSSTVPRATTTAPTTTPAATTAPEGQPTTSRAGQTTTVPPSGGAAVGPGSTSHGRAKQTGGSTDVRVPATFTIRAGGRLDPQTVSAPAFLAVRVTVSSADGRAHHVVVDTPAPHTLSVPAGGRGSILISGQRAGQYPIDIDGSARGALLIGGEPGP